MRARIDQAGKRGFVSQLLLLGLLAGFTSSCGSRSPHRPDAMPPGGDAFVQDDVPPPPSDSAPPAPSTELSIVRVVPNHGPFSGGNRVILRGSGFTEEAQVDFGGRRVQPADHRLIDRRRLEVVVPPGEVGSVDVTVRVASNSFTLRMGYTYDAIKV
ncbi:MAG: IPT/TIG domain-containing protein, partial [Deltaproteobacteria bacterium]|nr:IPT/TIG domain-containing protein [Deltaproteobacteria bacterium]